MSYNVILERNITIMRNNSKMNNTSNNNRSSSSSSSTRSSSSPSSSLSLSSLLSYFIGIILFCIISQTLLLLYRNNNNSNRNSNSIGNGINDYNIGNNGINDFNVELLLQRGDNSQQSNSNITADDMAWLGSLATITINNTNTNTNSDDNPLLLKTYGIINRKATTTTTTTTTSNRKLFFIHVGKTGGTTIVNNLHGLCQYRHDRNYKKKSKRIRVRNPCKVIQGKINISNVTIGYLHSRGTLWNSYNTNNANNANANANTNNANNANMRRQSLEQPITFVWTIRDPISRLVSAYNHHHPYNGNTKTCYEKKEDVIKKYSDASSTKLLSQMSDNNAYEFYCLCFPNSIYDFLNIFIQINHQHENTTTTDERMIIKNPITNKTISCYDIANNLMLGPGGTTGRKTQNNNNDFSHIDKGYNYYKNEIANNPHVLAGITVPTTDSTSRYRKKIKKIYNNYNVINENDIIVIRQEYLWYDMTRLEIGLESSLESESESSESIEKEKSKRLTKYYNDAIQRIDYIKTNQKSITHGSENYTVNDKISYDTTSSTSRAAVTTKPTTKTSDASDSDIVERMRRNMPIICCHILYEDIIIYIKLIRKAINLNYHEKQQSINQFLYNRCGMTNRSNENDNDKNSENSNENWSSSGNNDLITLNENDFKSFCSNITI